MYVLYVLPFGYLCVLTQSQEKKSQLSRSSIRIRHYQVLINEQKGFHKHNNLNVVDIRRTELFQERK